MIPDQNRTPRATATVRRTRWAAIAVLLLVGSYVCVANVTRVWAHHILGVPHYAYQDGYPQTPVLTYAAETGRFQMRMTGYPGELKAGDKCSLYVYLTDESGGGPLLGDVELTVFRDRFMGPDPIVYGPIRAELEEAVYKFYPRFEHTAYYTARIAYEDAGEPWTIDIPMVVGEPASTGLLLGQLLAASLLAAILVRAFLVKRARRAQ